MVDILDGTTQLGIVLISVIGLLTFVISLVLVSIGVFIGKPNDSK